MKKNIINNLKNQQAYSMSWYSNFHLPIPGTSKVQRGIGPELCNNVQKIFESIHTPLIFDRFDNFDIKNDHQRNQLLNNDKIVLGMYGTKIEERIELYKLLDIYAQVVFSKSIECKSFNSIHQGVDIAVFREITEGEYSGIEHEVYPGVIESIKVTTRAASIRLAKYAFEFAYISRRNKVTAVHKANIMKICDGLFLDSCREISKDYPMIQYEEMIIDNCTMQLVKNPQQFDVMVMPNLYGTIVNNTCSGITGSMGLTPGFDVGDQYQIFRQGNRHLGLDIEGKNQANPTAILLSCIQMLKMMNLQKFAYELELGLQMTLNEKEFVTRDIGGNSSSDRFVDRIIYNCRK